MFLRSIEIFSRPGQPKKLRRRALSNTSGKLTASSGGNLIKGPSNMVWCERGQRDEPEAAVMLPTENRKNDYWMTRHPAIR